MEIRVRQKGNIIILDLSGRIDINSANFVEAVGQCLHEGYSDILCNLEDVEFIDYMGVSAVVIAYKEIVNNKGRMKFSNIPAQIKNVFSIAGLDKVIDIYATEELALNSFQEDKAIENIKKMQLRRRFKRLPIGIKVELKVKDRLPGCLEAEIMDLSGVGAYIYDCEKFKLGDEVILKLNLPPKSEEIVLEARVVWLSDKQIQPQLHPGMGVEFYNIPNTTQKKLLDFIDKNLSLLSTDG
jgi:anti-anti-sigma factor